MIPPSIISPRTILKTTIDSDDEEIETSTERTTSQNIQEEEEEQEQEQIEEQEEDDEDEQEEKQKQQEEEKKKKELKKKLKQPLPTPLKSPRAAPQNDLAYLKKSSSKKNILTRDSALEPSVSSVSKDSQLKILSNDDLRSHQSSLKKNKVRKVIKPTTTTKTTIKKISTKSTRKDEIELSKLATFTKFPLSDHSELKLTSLRSLLLFWYICDFAFFFWGSIVIGNYSLICATILMCLFLIVFAALEFTSLFDVVLDYCRVDESTDGQLEQDEDKRIVLRDTTKYIQYIFFVTLTIYILMCFCSCAIIVSLPILQVNWNQQVMDHKGQYNPTIFEALTSIESSENRALFWMTCICSCITTVCYLWFFVVHMYAYAIYRFRECVDESVDVQAHNKAVKTQGRMLQALTGSVTINFGNQSTDALGLVSQAAAPTLQTMQEPLLASDRHV